MLVRKTEPEQQKGLDHHECHTHHPAERREGIFFEDGKGQEVERDEKGSDGDHRPIPSFLIRTCGGKEGQGLIGECQDEQRKDHSIAGKVPAKDEPKSEDDIRKRSNRLLQPHGMSLWTEKSNRCEKNQPAGKKKYKESFTYQIQHIGTEVKNSLATSSLVPDLYQPPHPMKWIC